MRTYFEVFGARDEDVSDAEWLEYCGSEGLAEAGLLAELRDEGREVVVAIAGQFGDVGGPGVIPSRDG